MPARRRGQRLSHRQLYPGGTSPLRPPAPPRRGRPGRVAASAPPPPPPPASEPHHHVHCARAHLPREGPQDPFWVQIVGGLVLGLALGYLARVQDVAWLTTTLDTIGKTFVQLLKLAVPPLVFTAIVLSVANLRNVTNAARLVSRTLLWF